MTKEGIISIVCEVCGVDPSEIKTSSRRGDVVKAKHLIAHFLYHHLNMRIEKIALEVALSKNSLYEPIYHNPAQKRIKIDPLFNELYQAVCRAISSKIPVGD